MTTSQQNEHTGVVGYVRDDVAQQLITSKYHEATVDLHFERGSDKIVMRVNREDIVEARPGKSQNGETLLQVILKHGSQVGTLIKAFRDIKAIQDPTLNRLTAAASVSVSFV